MLEEVFPDIILPGSLGLAISWGLSPGTEKTGFPCQGFFVLLFLRHAPGSLAAWCLGLPLWRSRQKLNCVEDLIIEIESHFPQTPLKKWLRLSHIGGEKLLVS